MADQNHYTVTARKWRPLTFDDVVGQDHITRTLKNSLKTGRIHHAALFTGSRGVGKTTTARIYARALNCPNAAQHDYEPCNTCDSCTSILNGSSLNVLEIDGASNNSVDDIRSLRENAKYAPSTKGYKVYIIDEVHMLSTAAFNALLKLLEEPPEHLLFIFATTEPQKILPTIISRTQRYDFRRMEVSEVVKQLKMISEKEGITIDERSLITIAKKGDGSMRDSQSIFDQVVAFCGKDISFEAVRSSLHLIDENLYFEIEDTVRSANIPQLFDIVRNILESGYDINETLHGLIGHYRNLYTVAISGNTNMIISDSETLSRYKNSALHYQPTYLVAVINKLTDTELELKRSSIPQARFEMALVGLASIPQELDLKSILSGINDEDLYEKKKALSSNQIENDTNQAADNQKSSNANQLTETLTPPTEIHSAKEETHATQLSGKKYFESKKSELEEKHPNQNDNSVFDPKQETSDNSVTEPEGVETLDKKMRELFNAKRL